MKTELRKPPRGWVVTPRRIGSPIEWSRHVGNYRLVFYPVSGNGQAIPLPAASNPGFGFHWTGKALRTIGNPVATVAVLTALDLLEEKLAA